MHIEEVIIVMLSSLWWYIFVSFHPEPVFCQFLQQSCANSIHNLLSISNNISTDNVFNCFSACVHLWIRLMQHFWTSPAPGMFLRFGSACCLIVWQQWHPVLDSTWHYFVALLLKTMCLVLLFLLIEERECPRFGLYPIYQLLESPSWLMQCLGLQEKAHFAWCSTVRRDCGWVVLWFSIQIGSCGPVNLFKYRLYASSAPRWWCYLYAQQIDNSNTRKGFIAP